MIGPVCVVFATLKFAYPDQGPRGDSSARTSNPCARPAATAFGKMIVEPKKTFGSATSWTDRRQYAEIEPQRPRQAALDTSLVSPLTFGLDVGSPALGAAVCERRQRARRLGGREQQVLGLRRLKESARRGANGRDRIDAVGDAGAWAPLVPIEEQSRLIEAQTGRHRQSRRGLPGVLHVDRRQRRPRPPREVERVVRVVLERGVAQPGLLGLVLVGDGKAELLFQIEGLDLGPRLEQVAPGLSRDGGQSAHPVQRAVGAGGDWRVEPAGVEARIGDAARTTATCDTVVGDQVRCQDAVSDR